MKLCMQLHALVWFSNFNHCAKYIKLMLAVLVNKVTLYDVFIYRYKTSQVAQLMK